MRTSAGKLQSAWLRSRSLSVCALHAALLITTLLAALTVHPVRASAEDKIALVVGNSRYRSVPPVINPTNDAADVAASLRRLGFSVKHFSDLDYDGFRHALIEFGQDAKTADKAVIFYAGHGVEIDGKNWLIPVDAEIRSEIDVYAEGINLETLIDLSVLPKVVGLVVLDACRNNPFASVAAVGRGLAMPNTPVAAAGAEKKPAEAASTARDAVLPGTPTGGLAPVDVTDNVLVAFSAAAGTTASDGDGRNSPYSGALLSYVEKPGLEINYLFRDVHDDVLKATRNTQEPAVYGTLSKDEIFLKDGDARAAPADQEAAAEKLAWSFVRATNDIAVLRRFSAQFPASPHKAEIAARLAQLESAETFAWDMVEKQHSASAYRAFLDLYPFGAHSDEARVTLASLAASANPDDAQTIDLPKPPQAGYTLSAPTDNLDKPDETSESIEKAWDVLRGSRDQNVVGSFAKTFPSLRHGRLPSGSDFGLRPVNSTEWMLNTAHDEEVSRCFTGEAEACVSAIDKYPDYVQLRFQLCRAAGRRKPVQGAPDQRAVNMEDCMIDAVEDARARGYLVSAFTRSDVEKARNAEYREAVSHVQQNVGNIVSNTVSNVVGNVVSNSVGTIAGAAAAAAAGSVGASGSAFPAPVLLAVPVVRWNTQLNNVKSSLATSGNTTVKATVTIPSTTTSKLSSPSSNAAGAAATGAATNAASKASSNAASNASKAATNAATNAASKAASNAASNAASKAASNAAGKAASNAASNAAGRAASNAASRAAGNAASNAASKAASNAASKAASNAASNAASKINIPSDIRLKTDIVPLARTANGLQIYRYRYIGDNTFYVGVMAQEVAERVPDAVARGANGYLTVDYGKLGLTFMTFDDWSRRNTSAKK